MDRANNLYVIELNRGAERKYCLKKNTKVGPAEETGEKIGEFAANLFTQSSAKMSDCYENPVYHLNDRRWLFAS